MSGQTNSEEEEKGDEEKDEEEEFLDTSDSEEVDNPEYNVHSKSGRKKRKRKSASEIDKDTEHLHKLVFILYENKTPKGMSMLRNHHVTSGEKSGKNRRMGCASHVALFPTRSTSATSTNNTANVSVEELMESLGDRAPRYPTNPDLMDMKEGVKDYFGVDRLIEYADDVKNGIPVTHTPELSVKDRIERVVEESDTIRAHNERNGRVLEGNATSSLRGYEHSLQENGASFTKTCNAGLSDASVAKTVTQCRVDVGSMERFNQNETGEQEIFDNMSAMMTDARNGLKNGERGSNMREKLLASLFSMEIEADKTWRIWGTDDRPSDEHVQYLGEPVDRRYMDDFLRPAIPYFNENPCVRGERCIGMLLPHLKNFPRTASESTRVSGIVLREFLLPVPKTLTQGQQTVGSFLQPDPTEEETEEKKTEETPKMLDPVRLKRRVSGCCVLCITFKQTRKCWESKRTKKTWPIQVQYFKVVTTPPYGFPLDRILPKVLPKSNVPTGFIEPALAFVPDDYQRSTRTIRSLDGSFETTVPCYVQVARFF